MTQTLPTGNNATAAMSGDSARSDREYRLAPQRRRWWAKARLWFWVAIIMVLCALAMAALTPDENSANPLDPDSTSQSGSHALAVLLREHGTDVVRSTDITTIPANATVVVSIAELYDKNQFAELAATHRLVLVAPSVDVLRSADPTYPNNKDTYSYSAAVDPDCEAHAAQAAGRVDFDDGAIFEPSDAGSAPDGYISCYHSRILIGDKLVVIGSSTLLTNAWLAHDGAAALDINLITNDGAESRIYWLMAAADPHAQTEQSLWVLFPDWAPRAALWLLLLSFIAALWKAARHAQVVTEPLPVIVRSAEVVEGHGRLYRKAPGNVPHAAQILRDATARRLKRSLGIGKDIPTVTVAAVMDSPGTDAMLLGAPPVDNAGLVRLAQDLARLETETNLAVPNNDDPNNADTNNADNKADERTTRTDTAP